jgi:hypothetical protein
LICQIRSTVVFSETSEENMTTQRIAQLTLTLLIATLLISACGGTAPSPTPTEVSLEAVYTAAAATVFARQTESAGAQPTKTATPTVTITATGTITATPAATRAVFVPVQPVVVVVAAITTTGTPGTLVPSITPTFGANGCNNSALVEDVAVPNTKAGDAFTKTWKIQNNGTCTWSGSYKFTFTGGNLLGRDNSTKIFKTVGKGETFTESLKFTAPTTAGTYTGSWRMADDNGVGFGVEFVVKVVVPSPTQTPVPATATKTPVTPTAVPATATPVTPTAVPATATPVTPTTVPATATPVTPTTVPATDVPPTDVPPTDVPPATDVPPTDVPPTATGG